MELIHRCATLILLNRREGHKIMGHPAISRLCALVTKVGAHFGHKYAHDCFCGQGLTYHGVVAFRLDDEIVEFIENAVSEKIMMESRKCKV
jgi:hypothetical protein